jgi:DNA polymerase (family 10)
MIPIDRALALAGVSSESASILVRQFSISTPEELAEAARSHRLRSIPGLNISLEYHILRCVRELQTVKKGILIDVARFQATEIMQWLEQQGGVVQIEIVGDIRRGMDLVRTVEVLAAAHDVSALRNSFASSPLVKETKTRKRSRIDVVSIMDIPVTLHVVDPERFDTTMLKLTGSQDHLRRLKKIAREQGLAFDRLLELTTIGEKEIYERLGLQYISPELREARGEIESALAGNLPDLIAADQILGDLHMHTNWADGLSSIAAMAEAARSMGYHYIAICDHSPLIEEANGLDPGRLRAQGDEIETLKRRYPDFEILKGLEVDIKADGTLDLADEALRDIDVVIASIHLPYDQDPETVTKRLISAMGQTDQGAGLVYGGCGRDSFNGGPDWHRLGNQLWSRSVGPERWVGSAC